MRNTKVMCLLSVSESDVGGKSQLKNSVKLSEMKLAFCVFDHVSEGHKSREGLDHSGMKKLN